MDEKNKDQSVGSRPKLKKSQLVLIACIAALLLGGWFVFGVFTSSQSPSEKQVSSREKSTAWTCSMHPQIHLNHPGKCPICGMTLIPVESDDVEGMPSNRRLSMSPASMKLAEIQTHPVEQKFVTAKVRMVGKVEYDETRIAYITAWTGGRIDRLYINQTGIPVNTGDHMAYLYSPELLSAQEEYLQALESVKDVKESHLDIIRTTSADTVKNAREKLKLLGITEEQIEDLKVRKVANDHMTIYATANGIVIQREVEEGDYVKTGSRIYSIVDLSNVWVQLDAYEADLQWLRLGQDVEFEAEAYPGDIFHGRISLIHPILDEVTRTIKIRVSVSNKEAKLKPGMFVRATVSAKIADQGRVIDDNLVNKWIAPMHPEIIRSEPGLCPICKMPLVPAQKLGYVTAADVEPPVVVLVTSVLKTGARAIVYVQDINASMPTFEGREVILGARAGDYYIVKSGLSKGEIVVTNGNFKIDSALQIQAKPSMMNPEGGVGGGGHDMSKMAGGGDTKEKEKMKADMAAAMAPKEFLEQLTPVYDAYFKVQTSLAADDLLGAKDGLKDLERKLGLVDMNLLKDKLHADWMDLNQRIKNSLTLGIDAATLDDLRANSFSSLSSEILSLEQKLRHSGEETHFKAFCPMALNGKGAFWLQSEREINNPFLGTDMPTCGDIRTEFAPMNMVSLTMKSKTQNDGGGHER